MPGLSLSDFRYPTAFLRFHRQPLQELAELDAQSYALPADHAGGGIGIFQEMPDRLPLELKIYGPGLVLFIPVYRPIAVAFV